MSKKLDKDNLPECFCPIPFSSLIFNPEGIVGSCREKGSYHEVGNINNSSWQEIWNGETLRKWRREFLTGNITTCKKEIADRSCQKHASNLPLLKEIELSEVQTRPPQRISPDFNGQCNLTCNMCYVYKKPNGLYDELNFWEDAEQSLFPFATQIDPLAGEPFVQKDFYRLIDIVSKYDSNPAWTITTNGHWAFNQSIKSKLDLINLQHISVSLDAIDPKIYREIRAGDLHTVLKALDALFEYQNLRESRNEGFLISVSYLVQVKNAWHLPEFMKFIEARKIPVEVQVEFEPEEFSVMEWTEEKREELLKFYIKNLSPQNILYCHRIIRTIMNSFEPEKRKSYLKFLKVVTANSFSFI